MCWSCSCGSSLWLSLLLPLWSVPYHCLRQVSVSMLVFFKIILFGQIWVVKLFFKPLINNLSLNCLFVCFNFLNLRFPHLFLYIDWILSIVIWSRQNISSALALFSLSLCCFSEGLHAFHRVLELLCDAVLLLGDSVCELVWDDRSLAGMELASQHNSWQPLM